MPDAIRLAVGRGCRHYRSAVPQGPPIEIPRSRLSDEELVALLLLGEQPYEPFAIRCAAQLARSPHIDPARLVRLARHERVGPVLAHIARAGLAHDLAAGDFWQAVLNGLDTSPVPDEARLPHWSRFVSMPGIQRNEPAEPVWLTPTS